MTQNHGNLLVCITRDHKDGPKNWNQVEIIKEITVGVLYL